LGRNIAFVKIDQRRVIDVALNLLDEEGLANLQMRAVAKRLDVQASALYWHVRNKAELLSLMSTYFYDAALSSVPEGLNWRDWLLTYGKAFRKSLLGHRDSAQLCAIAKPLEGDTEVVADVLTKPLIAAGLSRHLALSYQASVISLVLGWCIYEQSEALHDYLARMIGFDESFTTGLTALVAGFP
jgi:TetR/AcrR family transcriptional regulator, tetracycline repressor protein